MCLETEGMLADRRAGLQSLSTWVASRAEDERGGLVALPSVFFSAADQKIGLSCAVEEKSAPDCVS